MLKQFVIASIEFFMSDKIFEEEKYWFPAKRYGWGWGLPATWQGWVSLVLYLVLIVFFARVFPPDRQPTMFLVSILALSSILIFICWLKGEPPEWRWGDEGWR